VKLVRLQSGPLACVYQDEDVDQAFEHEGSGVFHAFSGSVEAEGASETEALDTLDRTLLRLSSPPADSGFEEFDGFEEFNTEPLVQTEAVVQVETKDTDHCPPRFESMLPPSCSGPDTIRAPRPSSLPAPAFAKLR